MSLHCSSPGSNHSGRLLFEPLLFRSIPRQGDRNKRAHKDGRLGPVSFAPPFRPIPTVLELVWVQNKSIITSSSTQSAGNLGVEVRRRNQHKPLKTCLL